MSGETRPSIVLVRPQLGDNIGAAARGMANFGLSDLRLVNPRDGWPNERADAVSAGAFTHLDNVQVSETVPFAVKDAELVLATTARRRDLRLPVIDLEEAVCLSKQYKTAILFGAERTGLENGEIAHAQKIVAIDTNPNFPSINLAQSVLLFCYAYSHQNTKHQKPEWPIAPMQEQNKVMDRLIHKLDEKTFFKSPERRQRLENDIRILFGRTHMTVEDSNLLHGIITALIQ